MQTTTAIKEAKMKAKRIKEQLHIVVDYCPNDYIKNGDDWELHISVSINDNAGEQHNLTPFGIRLKDLTVNELVKEIKDVIEEEYFDK